MGKIWKVLLLALVANGILATVTLARPVYLADGGIVQAQSVWQEDDKIYVLLNRDSLITFYPHELDLKKTFAKKWRNPPRKSAKTTVKPALVSEQRVSPVAVAPNVAKPALKPEVQPAPVTPVAPPSTSPAAPTKATPAPTVNAQPQAPQPKAASPVTPSAPAAPPKVAQPTAVSPPAPAATPKPAPPVVTAKPVAVSRPAIMPPLSIPQLEGGGTGLLVVLAAIGAFLLLLIASFWKVFTKAGQAGWKSLIPIYNLIVLLEIADCPLWWFLMFFIPIVGLWFTVVMHIKLAERFGKGALFGIFLCLFGFIFFPILAFDDSVYG